MAPGPPCPRHPHPVAAARRRRGGPVTVGQAGLPGANLLDCHIPRHDGVVDTVLLTGVILTLPGPRHHIRVFDGLSS